MASSHEPLVSVILRSFNEAWALRDTLPALQRQHYGNWELIVIDSGSSDGSVELLRAAKPSHFLQILPQDYQPGRVLNEGMRLARGAFGIFLNADATPLGPDWLGPLVHELMNPRVAAVYSRQVPRPGCRAVFARDYDRCFGPHRESARWDHFFSMVGSGIRRDIWQRRGFLESLQYSEDDEYTRWCRSQGYLVSYCPQSVVMHSHNYTPRQAYKRSFGEAWALAAVWDRPPSSFSWPRTVLLGWLADVSRDFKYCLVTGRLREWPHALRIRWMQRRARLVGFRAGWSMHREEAAP